MKKIGSFISSLLIIFAITSCTSNWPQFRGPGNNMAVKGKNLPTEWSNNKNIKWVYDIDGAGWGSPIVWGDKVFFSTAVLEEKAPRPETEPTTQARPTPPQNGQAPPPPPPADESYKNDLYRWELTCVDLKTGKELWKKVAHKGNPAIKTHAGNSYASETPVTDGKRVYVYYGMMGVYCYDMEGNMLWGKSLGSYETLNGWGTGSSPVVYNNILFIQVDNEKNSFLVALDAETGEEKWKVSRDEKTNYSTPIIWKNEVRAELITLGKKARSYDPETGELIWEMLMKGNFSIPSPVYNTNYLYIGKAGGRESSGTMYSVKAGAEGDITLKEGDTKSAFVEWAVDDAGTGNASPLLYNGLIYLLSGRGGELTCMEATTGNQVYKEKIKGVGACWASPWACNGKIYFYDERGTTQVIQAGSEFKLLHQNKIDDKFWASIAATKDIYIIKGVEKLYCIKKN